MSFSAHTQILAEHKCCFYILTWENVKWFKLGHCPSCSYLICGTQQLSFANDIVTSSSVIDGPSQVNVRDVTDTTALVTWFQPVAEVDGVTISYGPSLNSADRTLVELTSADTQYHLGNLTPDTEYEVSLTARRGEGTSIPIYESFLTGNIVTTVCVLSVGEYLKSLKCCDMKCSLEEKQSGFIFTLSFNELLCYFFGLLGGTFLTHGYMVMRLRGKTSHITPSVMVWCGCVCSSKKQISSQVKNHYLVWCLYPSR